MKWLIQICNAERLSVTKGKVNWFSLNFCTSDSFGGMGNLLIVECKISTERWIEKGKSHQDRNFEKKEKKKRRNDQNKKVCHYVLSV